MNASRPTKAVIPAAGRGTRLLPLTKVVPKALLPIGVRPALHHVLDELIGAGIRDVCLIRDPRDPIARHFDADPESACGDVVRLRSELRLAFVDGAASEPTWSLRRVRDFVGAEAIVIALPDELIAPRDDLLRDMVDTSIALEASVVAFRGATGTPHLFELAGPPTAPTVIAASDSGAHLIGRFVVQPDVLALLDERRDAELLDLLGDHARHRRVIALRHDGGYWDIGSPQGYVSAFVALADA